MAQVRSGGDTAAPSKLEEEIVTSCRETARGFFHANSEIRAASRGKPTNTQQEAARLKAIGRAKFPPQPDRWKRAILVPLSAADDDFVQSLP